MINLKSAPKPKPGQDASATLVSPEYDPPAYPYGLCLSLNTETIAKLGIKELPKVGTKVRIVAMAEVISVSQRQELDGGQDRDIALQITDMEPPRAKGGMYEESDMKD